MGGPLNVTQALHLWVFFSIPFIALSGFSHSVEKRNILSTEERAEKRDGGLIEKMNDLQVEEPSAFESASTQCVRVGDNEQLALQMDGDVLIGGFFPLHYLASELQHSYQSKPQVPPCSG